MNEGSDIGEHLDVAASTKIQGRIRNGATIRSGAQLTVYGSFEGPALVEADAILMVQGAYNGHLTYNDGTVILYGQVGLDTSAITGQLAVGIDSLITMADGAYRLAPDGQLIPVHGNQPAGSFNVRTDRLCFFDIRDGRFRPLSENPSPRATP